MIIFLHTPKCAGSSLRSAIEAKVGIEHVRLVYPGTNWADRIHVWKHRLRYLRYPKTVTIGHFCMDRHRRPGTAKDPRHVYAAIFRQPLQRAISLHRYYLRTSFPADPLWRRVRKDGWSLEQFLMSPETAELQSQLLGHFPVSELDYVGLAERYDDSVKLLGQLIPSLAGLAEQRVNLNPEKSISQAYIVSDALAEAHRALNPKDYALFEAARRRFDELWTAANLESVP